MHEVFITPERAFGGFWQNNIFPFYLFDHSVRGGNRTHDLGVMSATLLPTELPWHSFLRARWDLNPRSSPWQGDVLTGLHHDRMFYFVTLVHTNRNLNQLSLPTGRQAGSPWQGDVLTGAAALHHDRIHLQFILHKFSQNGKYKSATEWRWFFTIFLILESKICRKAFDSSEGRPNLLRT